MDGGRKAFYDQLFEEIAGLKMSKEPAVGGVFETVTSFEAIAESFPMLFVDIDTGEILYATKVAEEMFGYCVRLELVHQQVEVLMPSELRELHVQHRADFAKNPRSRPMGSRGEKLVGLHRDGHTFPLEISLSAAKIGNRRCVLAFIMDMSERVARVDHEQG